MEPPVSGWRKSSYSGGVQSNCVEVHPGDPVGVRDSKDRSGGVLRVAPRTWRNFVAVVTR